MAATGIGRDNLTGKDVLLDVGLSESDTRLMEQLVGVMNQLLPMVEDTTKALGKVMNTSHETFAAVRTNMDKHSKSTKGAAKVQLEMRDALQSTVKGIDTLAASTKKLTDAMEKYTGTARKARDATKDVGSGGDGSVSPGGLGSEQKAGSSGGTSGRIDSLVEDLIRQPGGDMLGDLTGKLFGRGVVGDVVKNVLKSSITKMGAVATPVLAALAGFKAYETAAQLTNKYEGATGRSDFGMAMGYEAKARMMSLSPFVSSEQAHQIVMSTLKSGYSGVKANTVMDFVAKNVKHGIMDINESIGLYKRAVGQAGASVEAVGIQLQFLQDVAADTSASVEGITKAYTESVGTLTAAGINGATATSASAIAAATFAGDGMGGFTGSGILTTALGQNAIGAILSGGTGSITYSNFGSATQGMSGISLERAAVAAQVQLLSRFPGLRPGMTEEEVGRIPDAVLRQVALVGSTYGLFSREQASDLTFIRNYIYKVLSGNADPTAQYGKLMGKWGPMGMDERISSDLAADMGINGLNAGTTGAERIDLYDDGWLNPVAGGLAPVGSEPYKTDEAISALGFHTMDAGGKYLPLIDKWLSSGDAQNTIIRDPETGESIFLPDYLNKIAKDDPDGSKRVAFMTRLFAGEIATAKGDFGVRAFMPDSQKGADSAKAKSLADAEFNEGGLPGMFGMPTDATSFQAGNVTIAFDPVAAKYLRAILPDDWEGLAGLPTYSGPSSGGAPGYGAWGAG